jgi:hypothetical protein
LFRETRQEEQIMLKASSGFLSGRALDWSESEKRA